MAETLRVMRKRAINFFMADSGGQVSNVRAAAMVYFFG
jgi:hypothetical protein